MTTVSHLYRYPFTIAGRPGSGSPAVTEQWKVSEQFMLADLAKSGLQPEDLSAYPLSFFSYRYCVAAYAIPYYDENGELMHKGERGLLGVMHRVRCKYRDGLTREMYKKCPKYMQPSAQEIGFEATVPYIRPEWWTPEALKDTRFIVEGEKKAAALAKRWGVGVLGIGGCGNWHNPLEEGDDPLHPWIRNALDKSRCKRVIIIPDGDINRFEIGRQYQGLSAAIGDIVELIDFDDKIDEWLVANPAVLPAVIDGWERYNIASMAQDRNTLVRDYNLQTRGEHGLWPNTYNVNQLLTQHPAYRGQFRLDLDKLAIVDSHGGAYNIAELVVDTIAHMNSVMGMVDMRKALVQDTLEVVAYKNRFSSRKAWLDGLEWDRMPRVKDWMVKALHVENNKRNRLLSVRALVAAVARIMEPGCMVDYMVILKGPQGMGKSSSIKLLFGAENVVEYTRGPMDTKDMLIAMHRNWCFVDEEVGALTRADQRSLKGLITTRVDTFRVPYGRETQSLPRRSVMWGTTNKQVFLPADETGHRRFAVIEVAQRVDFKWLEKNREQLWAEAVSLWRLGKVHYTNAPVDMRESIKQYVEEDVILEAVRDAATALFAAQRVLWNGRHWTKVSLVAAQMAQTMPDATRIYTLRFIGEKLRVLGLQRAEQASINGKHYRGVYWITKSLWDRGV